MKHTIPGLNLISVLSAGVAEQNSSELMRSKLSLIAEINRLKERLAYFEAITTEAEHKAIVEKK